MSHLSNIWDRKLCQYVEDDNQVVTLEEDRDNQSTISETTILSDQSEGNNVEPTLSKGDNIDGVEGACVNARYEDQVLEGNTANSFSNHVEVSVGARVNARY